MDRDKFIGQSIRHRTRNYWRFWTVIYPLQWIGICLDRRRWRLWWKWVWLIRYNKVRFPQFYHLHLRQGRSFLVDCEPEYRWQVWNTSVQCPGRCRQVGVCWYLGLRAKVDSVHRPWVVGLVVRYGLKPKQMCERVGKGWKKIKHILDLLIFICNADDLVNAMGAKIVSSPTCVTEQEECFDQGETDSRVCFSCLGGR